MKQTTHAVKIGNAVIGDGKFAVIAGPCSIESATHFHEVARAVQEAGACALRGGLFKPRSSPQTFQGLGRDAFDIARQVRAQTGLPFVSEVTDPRQVSDLYDIVDCYQVGTRNMHNYALLKELGQTKKPVLLKRGYAALIKEWLLAADYLVAGGNDQVVLCERGIRTFETATRYTLDLNAVAHLKANSSFPVIVDPSHGTGLTALVEPLGLAAAAVGADGVIIEVHPKPHEALSDGLQALNYEQFKHFVNRLDPLLLALQKERTRQNERKHSGAASC